MQTAPPLRATRFAQLKPGYLFICQSRNTRWLALAAEDNTKSEPEKLVLPIGPSLPQYMMVSGRNRIAFAARCFWRNEYILN